MKQFTYALNPEAKQLHINITQFVVEDLKNGRNQFFNNKLKFKGLESIKTYYQFL